MVDPHMPHVYCTLATHFSTELPFVQDYTLLPACEVQRKQCRLCELAVPVDNFRAQRLVCKTCTNEQNRVRQHHERTLKHACA